MEQVDFSQKMEDLRADIACHQHPELVAEELQHLIQTQHLDQEMLERYSKSLLAIHQFLEKVLRYEKYFADFYPDPNKISHNEALEHHVHAYIEDVDILRDKLKYLFKKLKKDLPKIASNKKEIHDAMEAIIRKIGEVFDGVARVRVPHHHDGTKFSDTDLLDGNLADFVLNQENMRSMLNEKGIAHFEKQKTESFEKARAH